MSATGTIARTNFTHTLRSRSTWVATGLMTLLVLSAWWTLTDFESFHAVDRPFVAGIAEFELWLPLFAIVLGYDAVVGERESGRVRVLLGQPGTRGDVVIGTFLGRILSFVAALAVVVAGVTALVTLEFGTVDPIEFLGGALLLCLFGLAWLGATIGVSALVATETRAVAIMVGLYALFGVLWNSLVVPLLSLAFTGSTDAGVGPMAVLTTLEDPTWYIYVQRLNPFGAFEGAMYYLPRALESLLAGGSVSAPHAPNLFGLVVLLVWATVPVAVGYRRFRRVDL